METPLFFPVMVLSACGVACTVAVGTGTSPEQVVQQACGEYAKAICDKLDQCRLNGAATSFGTAGNCIAVRTNQCIASQAALGSGNTPTQTTSCAASLPAVTCDDYLENNITTCAPQSGQLALGAACVYGSQCESAFCAIAPGDACGACAPMPAIGDECMDRGCAPDQTCSPQKTCVAWVATGGTCDKQTQVCAPSDACVIPSGATTGTCQTMPTTAGAPCDPKRQTAPGCAGNSGLFCSSKNVCTAISYVAAGAACGAQAAGAGWNVCTSGSACFGGTCVADAAEGESCDTSAGPSCIGGTRCVLDPNGTGTSGTCTTLDAAACM